MTFTKTNVFSYATDGSSSNVTTGVTITDLEDNFGRVVEIPDAMEDPITNDLEQTAGKCKLKRLWNSCPCSSCTFHGKVEKKITKK